MALLVIFLILAVVYRSSALVLYGVKYVLYYSYLVMKRFPSATHSNVSTTHQSGVTVPSPASTILGKFILTLSLFLPTVSKLAQQGLRWC